MWGVYVFWICREPAYRRKVIRIDDFYHVSFYPYLLYKSMKHLLDYIGKTGPSIIVLIAIFCLVKQLPILWMFLLFWAVNRALNTALKVLIREKRPHPLARYKNEFSYWGMPSGHAQSAGYCVSFLYFTRISQLWYAICGGLAAFTLWQRYYSEAHTMKQLLVGFVVGIAVGVFVRRMFLDH